MKDPVVIDFFIKAILLVIGALFTLLTSLLVWGIQKLASIIFNVTTSLNTLVVKVASIEKYVERIEKLEKDVNNYYQRLKTVEERGEKANG